MESEIAIDPQAATPAHDVTEAAQAAQATTATTVLDLDAIERDLADVEVALARLDAGTYWTDELTGRPIDDSHLVERPTARRAEG